MTNKEAGDFLIQKVLHFDEGDSDYNQAIMRGALALLLIGDEEVDKMVEAFVDMMNQS